MFGFQFQPESIRKYVVLFGTLFNQIHIKRLTSAGTYQTFRVPLSYGPQEKFLARLKEDPDLNRPNAITLPRIGFEMTNASYDGSRKMATIGRNVVRNTSSNDSVTSQYVPVPYNFEFTLTILSKTAEDATRIIEQILPFFTPQWNIRAKINDPMMNIVYDIPVVLNSVISQDTYDDAFTERRAVYWTLTFTLKGWIYGPASSPKVIKIADTNFFVPGILPSQAQAAQLAAYEAAETITITPGLTANGEPTTVSADSIPITEINIDDDYGFVVEFDSNVEGT